MEFKFSGELWFWQGPSPFHFVTVDATAVEDIHAVAPSVTYGWGMIPCTVTIGATEFTTSLWPKDGGYILPVKTAVRDAEQLEVTDVVEVILSID